MRQPAGSCAAVSKLFVLVVCTLVAAAGVWVIPGAPVLDARPHAVFAAPALTIRPAATATLTRVTAPAIVVPAAPAPARRAEPPVPAPAMAAAAEGVSGPGPALGAAPLLVAAAPGVAAVAPGLFSPEPTHGRPGRWAAIGASFARAGARVGEAFTP